MFFNAAFMALSVMLALNASLCDAYNILFMSPFPAPSHWMWLEYFQNDLLRRGHHITTVNNFRAKQPHPNLTEIIIDPSFDIPTHFPKKNIFAMRYSSDFQNLQMWWQVGLLTSEYALNDPKLKALIANKNLKFDLFILEQFFHESFLMFAHKFNCPTVTIGTMGYADNMDHAMGLITPWSIIPHLVLSYTDEMSFTERAYNAWLSLYDGFWRRWYYIPKMQEMARRHFSASLQMPLPELRDLEKNISLMLINSHRSMDLPRPSMPGLIDVGGAHIKSVKQLPKDLQDFLDKSSNGVVYFSLGSYMKSTDMPEDKINIILKGFSKLKQNVLWKYENESMGHLPENVMIKKWLPQNDILAHPNIKVFITHGGLFGTQEGVYWGVPMLCIPLYGDQHRNSIKSVRAGYARSIVFSELTPEVIVENVEKLIYEPKYMKNAKAISIRFRDNALNPLDEASHWIEYVIRHKGASHLKSYGAYIPLYQYLLLDIIGCVLLTLFICIWMPWKILKFVIKSFNNSTQMDKKKKQ